MKFPIALLLALALNAGAEEYPLEIPEEYLLAEPADRKIVGPMVGHVSESEAQIWFYAGRDKAVGCLYWKDQNRGVGAYQTLLDSGAVMQVLEPRRQDNYAVRFHLRDLKPETRYRYAVFVANRKGDDPEFKTKPQWVGSFLTAPPQGQPARFTMATASCLKYRFPFKSSWYLLMNQQPSLLLLLGDIVYADKTDPQHIWKVHMRQRSIPEFAAVIRQVPTYAMWDDHDYGANDSDGTLKGKKNSLRAFKQVWANPGAGSEKVPGAFFKFSRGDVEFFVLDGRYHRSPNREIDDREKYMLGEGQFRWLVENLKASKATFKVLASGSTLRASKDDGWRRFEHARKRLYRAIADNDIGGVLYLSGDVHRSFVQVHPKKNTGFYDLYEVISSGITSSETRSFATLSFDTTVDDPTVRIRIIHGDGTVRDEHIVKVSQLQVGNKKP